ncbi:hypothetical protein V6617_06425 [Pelagibacterium nitratireducens]|uniref:TniQ protein n=1 Tax=Pelagibacterium nitratireducens TaxID=1046114 RepID=A0ABZ2I424_9HYPH|tara:strand:- start:2258 stop:4210 length:1953 start_codon:yes stop_codon:yes gene_type:complete
MRRLIIATDIYPDEHLPGAVARAAEANGRQHCFELLQMVDVKSHHPGSKVTELDDNEAERLAVLMRTRAPSVLQSRHLVDDLGNCGFFGTTIRNRHREAQIRRVSPRAMAMKPYVRAMWQLKPFSFDPQTKEALISACPVCHRGLGFSRTQGICFCDWCSSPDDLGFAQPTVDLRDFPQPIVELEDIEALDFVTGLVDPDPDVRSSFSPQLDNDLSGLSRGEVFELAMAITGIIEQDPRRAVTSPAKPKTRQDYARVFTPERVAEAGRILLNWPKGFDGLCEKARATAPDRAGFYGIKSELGQVYALTVDRTLSEPARALVRGAVERNMELTSSAVQVRRAEHRGRSDLITIQEAAERHGLDRRVFTKLLRFPEVTRYRSSGTSKGPVLLVSEEIASLVALREDLESSSSVGLRLGIPNGSVSQLAAAGLIEKVTGPVLATVTGKHQYRRSSVDKLIGDIEARIVPRDKGEFHIRLTKAMYRLPAGEKPWVPVVQAILDDRLKVFAVKGRLEATLIRLAAPSFEAITRVLDCGYRPPIPIEPTVTRAEAADLLGITVATTIAMVNEGIIPSHGSGVCTIYRRDVLAVAEAYITTAEISRMMGVGYRWVRTRLATLGVEPQFELRKNRGLVYDRRQVVALCAQLRTREDAA